MYFFCNCNSTARILCVTFFILCIGVSSDGFAAAPDDIDNQQKGWFDAVDINANGDYTDNPANSTSISQWRDKSGSANHLFATGSQQPVYQHNSLSTQRHGVDFDGINDQLIDADDIWTGSVDEAEIFVVATTDTVKNSFLFLSIDNTNNRVGVHAPWGNNRTYFDLGPCCGNPTRLQGVVPIATSTGYIWQFVGAPGEQLVVQDGVVVLSDGGANVYTQTVNSTFALGNRGGVGNIAHHGRVFESLFYQSPLNIAQRRIVSSYLSAKWGKGLAATADYADVYNGDAAGNGDYDFFVGGIGRDSGQQSQGTSQGLTITNDTFLGSDEKFMVAGVDYLLSAPTSGTTSVDIPATYLNRSQRSWFIDTTGAGGLVKLTFDASDIGVPANNGMTYGLLYRAGTTGIFTEVATAVMSSGEVSFSHLPDDGVYVLGLPKSEVELSLKKDVSTISPNIGDLVTFTLTVSNAGPNTAVNAAVSDLLPAGFSNPVLVSSPIGSTLSIVGNSINWTGISVLAGDSVSSVFTAEVMPP